MIVGYRSEAHGQVAKSHGMDCQPERIWSHLGGKPPVNPVVIFYFAEIW